MAIVNNDELETLELPGLKHRTIGGHKQGVRTIAAGVVVDEQYRGRAVADHLSEDVARVDDRGGE